MTLFYRKTTMHNVITELQPFLVPIDSLKGALINPRTHSRDNINDIKLSLTTFGQDQLIVVRKADNTIIKGNGRWTGMKELGWTDCAAIFVDDDEARAMARGIADNHASDTSDWDNELLLRELRLLDDEYLASTGYTPEELDELAKSLGQEADNQEQGRKPFETMDAEALVGKYSVKPGKTWQIGTHRLICADSSNPQAMANLFRGDTFAMAFAEFPVDQDISFVQRTLANFFRYGIQLWSAYIMADDHLVRRSVASYALTMNTPIVWIHNRKTEKSGIGLYRQTHEQIFFVGPGSTVRDRWFGESSEGNSWNCSMTKTKIAQLPVELVEKAIRNSTLENEIVHDPFGGSGTSMMAAQLNNRVAYVAENDLVQCGIILERMSQVGLDPVELDQATYPVPEAPEIWKTMNFNFSESQARVVADAIASLKLQGNNIEARAIELICADYLAGH